MIHCGSQYGVFVDGKWRWLKDRAEAVRMEAEALSGKVQKKLESGGTVILTTEMWKQVEAAAKDARTSPAAKSAH